MSRAARAQTILDGEQIIVPSTWTAIAFEVTRAPDENDVETVSVPLSMWRAAQMLGELVIEGRRI